MFSELSAILKSFVSEGLLMVVIPGLELSFGESKILHRRDAIYLRDRRLVHHAILVSPDSISLRRCGLCLMEKLFIARADKRITLNSHSELVSMCRHKGKRSLGRSSSGPPG